MTAPARLRKPVNVASVPQRSVFRYPGGKTWLVPQVRDWLQSLPASPGCFAEPFAGGGIIGLTVAFEGLADHVHLVELDEQVASVWRTVLDSEGSAWLADRILGFNVTQDSVRSLLADGPTSIWEQAFQTIVKNRTYHGGILARGSAPIRRGENGKGIASRWYAETLSRRILAIAKIRDRITFTQGDAMTFISERLAEPNTVWFIDPPYSASSKHPGSRLYTHFQIDHPLLFYYAANLAGDFLMTYDDADEIRQFASTHGLEIELVPMTNRRNALMTELLIGRDLEWARV